MRKTIAAIGAVLLAMVAGAQVVTNVALVATPAMPPGGMPALVRIQKTAATHAFDAPGGAFQVQSVTVRNALVNNGTVIVNRVNGAMTNALTSITVSSGEGTATLVDAYGYPNAHLIYAHRSGAAYNNDDADTILLTGTCTNAIVELKGVRWY